jgi:hypothetical protein
MGSYPKALLPHHTYPARLSGEEILDCFFVRETNEDIYPFFDSGLDSDDLIKKIIVQPTSKRDVFELSVFLYGYYHEGHAGIRTDDEALNAVWDNGPALPIGNITYKQMIMFPLFLSAARLYERPVDFSDEKFVVSFLHKPTRANYWHFQLFTQDDKGNVMPRNKDNSRLNRLAKHILENIVIPAICPKGAVKKFHLKSYPRSPHAGPFHL